MLVRLAGNTRRLARMRSVRAAFASLVTVVVLLGLAMVGLRHTDRSPRIHLSSGSLWVTSNAVGELTLLDGTSASVAARVRVAQPGDRFTAAQWGTTAFAVDQINGNVVRVDGATLTASDPTSLLHGTHRRVQVVPLPRTLLAIDHAQGVLATADPQTLEVRDDRRALPSLDAATIAVGDKLWLLDRGAGELGTMSADEDRFRPLISASSRAILAATDGQLATVDVDDRSVRLHHGATGQEKARMPVAVLPGDLVTGSPHQSRVLIVGREQRKLTVCYFHQPACESTRTLDTSTDLGAAVEADDHAFVPDHTNGYVWIVNLRRVTDPPIAVNIRQDRGVTHTPSQFEVIARDGIVFFNYPGEEIAGTIDADGNVIFINKARITDASLKPTPSARRSGALPGRSTSPRPRSSNTPTMRPSSSGAASRPATKGSSATAGPGRPTTGPSASAGPARLHIASIQADPKSSGPGRPVHFSAIIEHGPPDTWEWHVQKNSADAPVLIGREPEADHTFTAVGDYTVTLTVRKGTATDHDTVPVSVRVPPRSAECGDTITTDIVLTKDLDCSGNGLVVAADDITVDLGGHTIKGPGGSTIGILVSGPLRYRNVSIVNGTVRGFGDGVLIYEAEESEIRSVSFLDNGTGIRLLRAFRILMENITAHEDDIIGRESTTSTIIRQSTLDGVTIGVGLNSGFTITKSELINSKVSVSEGSLEVNQSELIRSSVSALLAGLVIVRDNPKIEGEGAGVILGLVTSSARIENNTFVRTSIGVSASPQSLSEMEDFQIIDNTFTDNAAAGVLLQARDVTGGNPSVTISGNTFRRNGNRSGGRTDTAGRPINDGLHINLPTSDGVTVADNTTVDNADYGIEAQPGMVVDGGGNSSDGDPRGCLGVSCE